MKQTNKFLSFLLVIVAAGSMFANAQQKTYDAYRLYDNNGKTIDYQQMVRQLSKADVVFLGEIHNCAITHWLELHSLIHFLKKPRSFSLHYPFPTSQTHKPNKDLP